MAERPQRDARPKRGGRSLRAKFNTLPRLPVRRPGCLYPQERCVSCRVPRKTTAVPVTGFGAAYSSGQLDEFFSVQAGDLEAALAAPRSSDREKLAGALRRNARRLGAPEAVLKSIDRLEHPDSRVVIAGQQVGLLLGPTYTLSKAATAVLLAQRLDTPERPVIPLFWMATQDHDSLEIDHTYLLDSSEELKRVAVDLPAGVPAGRLPLTGEMLSGVKRSLEAAAGGEAFLPQVLTLLDEAAATGGYADWFAAILMRFLGEAGLVPVDPLQPDFAELTLNVIRGEIEEPRRSATLINSAGARLRERGYAPQLGRGANATNLFVELPGERLPQRHPLKFDGGRFTAAGRSLSRADLLALIENDPTTVTPAAGLRPITQDAALPTAVFVLGPGELKYVAQLRGVYEQHAVPMPLAWVRASAQVLEPAAARLLSGLGVSATEFKERHAALKQSVLLTRAGHSERFEEAKTDLETAFTRLLNEVEGIDPTLRGTVERGRRHLSITIARLREGTARAAAERDAITERQFARLLAHLLPGGAPSERTLSPFSHVLKFGFEPIIDRFLSLEPAGEQEVRI